MKKLLMFMLVLGVLSLGLAMAQDAASPTITTGVEATAAFNAVSSHTDATVDSKFLPTTLSNPYGLSATGFVVAPWLTVDWGDLVVNVSATADSMDYNKDDSTGQATLNIKKSNLFGYSGFALVAQVKQYSDAYSAAATMDNQDNYFGFLFENDVVTAEVDWNSFADIAIIPVKFKKANVTFNDGNLEARAEVATGVGSATQITENTYLKYNKLFGFWTMSVGLPGDMRLSTEATGSKIGTFNHDNFYYWDNDEATSWNAAATPGNYNGTGLAVGKKYGSDGAFDVMNTFAVMDGLSVKLGTVAPTSKTTIKDWLRGDNLFVGAEYTMDGLGTFNVGFAPVMDYDINSTDSDLNNYTGSRSFYSQVLKLEGFIASTTATHGAVAGDLNTLFGGGTVALNDVTNKYYKVFDLLGQGVIGGSSFWLDADLSSMMDALTFAVSVDGQLGKYLNRTKWNADVVAGMNGSTTHPWKPVFENESRFNIGFNAEYAVSDALSFTADGKVTMVTGLDYKKYTGSPNTYKQDWGSLPAATNYYTSNHTEANSFLAYGLGNVQNYGGSVVNPLAVNVGAKYSLNDMFAVSLSNGYTALAGSLDYMHKYKVSSTGNNFSAAGAKTMHGYYGKNAIGLGAVVTPQKNMKISIDLAYSLFLGLPGVADLYTTGLTTAQKNVINVAYDKWIDANFNPWSASVAYTYSF